MPAEDESSLFNFDIHSIRNDNYNYAKGVVIETDIDRE